MSNQEMQLKADTVRVFVSALSEAKQFYAEKLGLPLVLDDRVNGHVLFKPGAISLLIESVDASDIEAQTLVGRFVGLSFRVDDVEAACRKLRDRGVQFEAGPEKQPWGGTLAHFLDPDRNVLTLVSGAS